GAMTFAVSATTTSTRTTAAPAAPRGRRRVKSLTIPHHPARASWAAVSSAASKGTLMAITHPRRGAAVRVGRMYSDTWLSVPDSRVEPAVRQVHDEVHHDEDRRHQQDQRLGHRVIPACHRLHEEQAEPVQVEHLLRHHEPAHEECELDAGHREHGEHRVLEG